MKNKKYKAYLSTDQPVTLKKPNYNPKTIKAMIELIKKGRKIKEDWEAKNIKNNVIIN